MKKRMHLVCPIYAALLYLFILQEKKAAELAPSSNSIRWNLGPTSSIVSFSEDVGLPSFFSSGPCRLAHALCSCFVGAFCMPFLASTFTIIIFSILKFGY